MYKIDINIDGNEYVKFLSKRVKILFFWHIWKIVECKSSPIAYDKCIMDWQEKYNIPDKMVTATFKLNGWAQRN